MTLKKSMSLILLALTTTSVLGQTSTTEVESVNKTPAVTKAWSLGLESTFDRDLLKTSEPDHTSGMETEVSAGYKFNFGSISIKSSFYKSFVDERKATMNDSSISYKAPAVELTKGLATISLVSFKIPTSELSRDYANLRTGASLIQLFAASEEFLKLKNISIVAIAIGTKNFHEFKTSLTGSSNTSHSLSGVMNISYSVTDKLSFTLGGTYSKGWTYENNTRDVYSFAQSIGYEFSPLLSLEVGHQIGGTPLSPNGKNVELQFFEERDASVFATIGIKI